MEKSITETPIIISESNESDFEMVVDKKKLKRQKFLESKEKAKKLVSARKDKVENISYYTPKTEAEKKSLSIVELKQQEKKVKSKSQKPGKSKSNKTSKYVKIKEASDMNALIHTIIASHPGSIPLPVLGEYIYSSTNNSWGSKYKNLIPNNSSTLKNFLIAQPNNFRLTTNEKNEVIVSISWQFSKKLQEHNNKAETQEIDRRQMVKEQLSNNKEPKAKAQKKSIKKEQINKDSNNLTYCIIIGILIALGAFFVFKYKH